MPDPVRCFTCSRILPQSLYNDYRNLREKRQPKTELDKLGNIIIYSNDISYKDFFDERHITRECCKIMVATSISIDDKIS